MTHHATHDGTNAAVITCASREQDQRAETRSAAGTRRPRRWGAPAVRSSCHRLAPGRGSAVLCGRWPASICPEHRRRRGWSCCAGALSGSTGWSWADGSAGAVQWAGATSEGPALGSCQCRSSRGIPWSGARSAGPAGSGARVGVENGQHKRRLARLASVLPWATGRRRRGSAGTGSDGSGRRLKAGDATMPAQTTPPAGNDRAEPRQRPRWLGHAAAGAGSEDGSGRGAGQRRRDGLRGRHEDGHERRSSWLCGIDEAFEGLSVDNA